MCCVNARERILNRAEVAFSSLHQFFFCHGFFFLPWVLQKINEKKKISKDQESKHDEPETRVYEILNINKFTSHRKRMSVVVRTETGELRLLVKGADDAILPVLKAGSDKVKCLRFPPPEVHTELVPLSSSEISFSFLKIFVRPPPLE